MAVFEEKSNYQNKPFIQQVYNQWDSSIIPHIKSSSQLQSQSADKCDLSTKECKITTRLSFIMQFYSSWINAHSSHNPSDTYLSISISAFISNLTHYSMTQLINDWHHLREYHWNTITKQYETRQYFQSATDHKCEDITNCTVFARVNRDREQTRKRAARHKMYFIKDNNDQHTFEITTQQLCDCIHDWIYHIPIIPKQNDTQNMNNTIDIDSDEDCSFIKSLNDNKNTTASVSYEARKQAIAELKIGDKYYQHSKFVTKTAQFEESEHKKDKEVDDEKKTERANSVMMSASYEFGVEMMYTQQYRQYARYTSIREEVLNNITMNQWQDTVTKAKLYIDCTTAKNMTAIEGDPDLGINVNDALSADALIVCLLYTNFTDLQRKFSSSTRRYTQQQNKTDKDIRIEHYRDYFHWGQMLMVSIKCFGQKMTEKTSFYHGIDTELVFADFIAYFNCPISTTAQVSVASSFASDDGIILRVSGAMTRGARTKFMNVCWLSDYPNEDERLLYGYHNQLEILSIYCDGLNYMKYIRALKVFDVLTDPFCCAAAANKYAQLGAIQKRKKYCNHLLSMIKKEVDTEIHHKEIEQQKVDKIERKKRITKEIPQYMMNIFNYFVIRQTAITFDLVQFQELNHGLSQYFIIEQKSLDRLDANDYCLNFEILLRLFPNATSFRLVFGDKLLTASQLEFLCQSVSNAVHSSVASSDIGVNIVEFTGLQRQTMKKTLVKRMKTEYFGDALFEIKVSAKSVQFIRNTKSVTTHYENIFIGNLYQKNKDKRTFTVFVSTSKQKLIVPKSIKQVTYYLDEKLYEKAQITVNKPPYSLKRKVKGIFEVKLKIEFRGKRQTSWYYHVLDVVHPVTISNRVCDADCKKHVHDIYHSNNIRDYDYWI